MNYARVVDLRMVYLFNDQLYDEMFLQFLVFLYIPPQTRLKKIFTNIVGLNKIRRYLMGAMLKTVFEGAKEKYATIYPHRMIF